MNHSTDHTDIQKKGVALITGSSRGIGAAIAKRLSNDGYFVVINFQNSEDAARKTLEACNGNGVLSRFNLSEPSEIESAFGTLAPLFKEKGGLRTVVNNAGINKDSLIMRLKNEDIDSMLMTNLKGSMIVSREASKIMMRERQGSIIQISSVVGEMGSAGQSAYSATKAGLIGFTKSLARELASRNIRVNAVTPGFVESDMTQGLTDAQKEAILHNIPLGCMAAPEDIASAVSFLASSESRYITGHVLSVNGGLYM